LCLPTTRKLTGQLRRRLPITWAVSATLPDDPAVEQLLETNDARAAAALRRRDLVVELVAAASLLAVTGALVAGFGLQRSPSALVVALLVVVYAIVGRVQFDVGAGFTSPSELIFVPMAFVLPPALLPPVVGVAAVLQRFPDLLGPKRTHPARLLLNFADAWYAIGPAVVLCAAGAPSAALRHWPIFAAALVAQFACDIGAAIVRERLRTGVAPALQLRMMSMVASVDAALAPVGLLVAMAMEHETAALVLVLPLAALLMFFAREREVRIQQALQLSGAYRGTALLMGDVLEADDAYTGGEHSQGVVAMAIAVGETLALDPRAQRDLEFAALLHDIGKLRIPNEIINKPGKLTDEEWEIVRRHPAIGQEMLERVGGRLTEVGRIVRAHHERMDGNGYPDGLVGEQIPIAARIITACDAYSAMTTDRSYRRALPHSDAVAELLRCTPAQFDPRIVSALLAVVETALPAEPAGGVGDEDGVEDGVVHDTLLA